MTLRKIKSLMSAAIALIFLIPESSALAQTGNNTKSAEQANSNVDSDIDAHTDWTLTNSIDVH